MFEGTNKPRGAIPHLAAERSISNILASAFQRRAKIVRTKPGLRGEVGVHKAVRAVEPVSDRVLLSERTHPALTLEILHCRLNLTE